MGFWGALIGGVVGGLVGGPVGAGLGVAAGAAIDEDENDDYYPPSNYSPPPSNEPPTLPMEVQFINDSDGKLLLFSLNFPTENVGIVSMRIVKKSTHKYIKTNPFLNGEKINSDNEGDFFVILDRNGPQDFSAYIPSGLLNIYSFEDTLLEINVLHVDENEEILLLGNAFFNVGDWQSKDVFSICYLARPLLSLAMHVARASGSLHRAKVTVIREFFTEAFELNRSDLAIFKEMMKMEPSNNLSDSVEMLFYRMAEFPLDISLQFFADIAHANGQIHSDEISVIREIVRLLGGSEESWLEISTDLRLVDSQQLLSAAYAVLGLSFSASKKQTKRAYREKMRSYHPDIVANLPQEFQDLANQKSQEINEAYELISKSF